GNMALSTDLTDATVKSILANNSVDRPIYKQNAGPIDVKVVDPLNVTPGHYELKFIEYGTSTASIDTANWVVYRYTQKGGAIIDSVRSDRTIAVGNEQIIPEWGVSITIEQKNYTVYASPAPNNFVTEPLEA